MWHRIADFGNLACWVDGVTDCELDGEGTGAIRTVGLGKHSVRERLEAIDPDSHVLWYRVLEPHGMPARSVVSEMRLTSLGPDRTQIAWVSRAEELSVPAEIFGPRIGAF
ncbi:SRPBCC family protein [Bradyrhizobium liaoningense]